MKKISLLFTLAFLAFSASLFGQVTPSTLQAPSVSDQVTLNVKLNAIQTLVVKNNQKNITLEYKTKKHYQDGVKSENKDHLTVYSTGGFQLMVESSNSEFNDLGVRLIATKGTTDGLENFRDKDILVSTLNDAAKKTLYTAAYGKNDSSINVTYAGKGNNAYFTKLGTEQSKTFTTTLTYTLTPQ
ncbi:hypothetical protein MVI27_03745 [Chryseobacterium salipaludis]|uniref:hypothetical protein n=1 Tax=Chryseobacterium TaxID=59732 RepID=UPI001FF129B6|nr:MULTISPECIES: hypothetical protein [Chryseobacterium]MCJ8497369.1 hypothetical protein [Chryseobacterium salipaludis]MCX3295776.1 hypothetical protein [Planobacterium sp. JC490]